MTEREREKAEKVFSRDCIKVENAEKIHVFVNTRKPRLAEEN
jgi:hypothetical protein